MSRSFIYRWGIYPLWFMLTVTIFFRNPVPIDETRYLSVAWEMWLQKQFWVPLLNGQAYSHKPPLLFWLFQLGWAVFGVNEWWPKLVGPLCALLNLHLLRWLALKLWPQQPSVSLLAPWVLMGTLLWSLFATSMMFDILLSTCVLLGMLGNVLLFKGQKTQGMLLLSLGLGLGLLAKGPVVFLHVLPTTLLAAYWTGGVSANCWRYCFLSVLAGIGLALLWALPAAWSGGRQYASAIFWTQTADRTLASNIHARPVWWYAQFTPLILFPWIIWWRFWLNLRELSWSNADMGLRFSILWMLSGLLIFSVLPSKQIHYILPVLPAFALLVARILLQRADFSYIIADYVVPATLGLMGVMLIFLPHLPGFSVLSWARNLGYGWGLSVCALAVGLTLSMLLWRLCLVQVFSAVTVATLSLSILFFFNYNAAAYDLRPAAQQLAAYNQQHIVCAFVGNYQGQLHFLGRLQQILPTLTKEQVAEWATEHPQGCLISMEKQKPSAAEFLQAHREYWLVFRRVEDITGLKPL